MKDSRMKLYLWRLRKVRKRGVRTCEPLCEHRVAGRVRRLALVPSTAIGCSRILIEKAHFFRRTQKRYRVTIGVLVCVLAAVAVYAHLGISNLRREKSGIDGQILQFETRRAAGGEEYMQIGHLIDRLTNYEVRARELQKNILVQMGETSAQEALINQEINALMKEFGAEEFSIPPEFLSEVNRFVRQYQGRDHDLMARTLVAERADLERMRQILRRDHLPEDLAYVALVESGFLRESASQNGAVGLWQFTEETAREYGMEVSETVDERLDLSKSTEAASRYLRDLILDFGTGSSVMLALAAYNSGPEKVRRAVRNVKDPIKQRSFWHLYRTRALPEETREYVPKVIAAILIGRNPKRFGFYT
jgi:soluble lytic murein transglycosylase-like protein